MNRGSEWLAPGSEISTRLDIIMCGFASIVVQEAKHRPFLNHASSFYTIELLAVLFKHASGLAAILRTLFCHSKHQSKHTGKQKE